MSDGDARKAQTRAAFDAIAPDYDVVGPGVFAHFGRRLMDVSDVGLGQRVLDVATGRGAVLFPAAERVGGTVVGIDLAETMVRATSAEAGRRGLTVDLRVMDAEQLDFPDASFDRVLCGFGIMFFPDLARALGEYRRVLRPGGRLGVSTWRTTHTEDAVVVLDQLGLNKRTREATRFSDPDELARLLAAAGFDEVRVLVDQATFRYANLEAYWQSVRSTISRWPLDALDAVDRARTEAALTERLRPYQREDGLHVGATALLATARP